jgi:hypothetical protein
MEYLPIFAILLFIAFSVFVAGLLIIRFIFGRMVARGVGIVGAAYLLYGWWKTYIACENSPMRSYQRVGEDWFTIPSVCTAWTGPSYLDLCLVVSALLATWLTSRLGYVVVKDRSID